MSRPARLLSKVTAKNQITLPQAAMAAAGWPTHFRVQVHKDAQGGTVLLLWPGLLVTEPEAARTLGIDTQALRDARAATRARAESGGTGSGGQG